MSEQTANTWDQQIPRDAVAENLGGAYWSVSECRWESVGPALPDDLADLVAPPITVGAAPYGVDVTPAAVIATDVPPAEDAEPTAMDHLDMLIFDPRTALTAPRRTGRHRRALRVG